MRRSTAMIPIREADTSELYWVHPHLMKRQYELYGGNDLLATLCWKNLIGSRDRRCRRWKLDVSTRELLSEARCRTPRSFGRRGSTSQTQPRRKRRAPLQRCAAV